MTAPGLLMVPRNYADLRWCAGCRTRLTEVTVSGMTEAGVWRTYQCAAGCRTRPVDADWFDDLVVRALPGRIGLQDAHLVLNRIVLTVTTRPQVRLSWHSPVRGPQPAATPLPVEAFLPVRR